MDRKKILVIDDEADQIQVAQARLELSGFEVVSAMDGETGLRTACDVHPDIVLIDVILPGVDGFEICRRLKREPRTKDIPIILVTASGIRDLQERCEAAGADAWFRRPYDPAEVVTTIRALVKQPQIEG